MTLEDSTQLFYQAGTLMLVGMGFVFGFLSLLIIVIKTLISPLASRYPDSLPQTNPLTSANITSSDHSGSVVAAISAAVNRYRKDHPTDKKH